MTTRICRSIQLPRQSTVLRVLGLFGITAFLICIQRKEADAQLPPDPDFARQQIFPSYSDFKAELLSIVGISDRVRRDSELDDFWTTLQNAGQVPYAQSNQFAFLYRGTGGSVSFPGDLNRWNPSSSSAQATNFAGTDLWIREGTLPTDARTDYKIVVNGSWILDPANPLQMWGGFGPNSELRMPEYEFPQETVRRDGIPRGLLTGNIRTTSVNLGQDFNYRVYTPAGYDGLDQLPTVYVTDGHEYAADHMGSMVVVLDNLIAEGRIWPAITVFIDPRDPDTSVNRREDLYLANFDFADFVADELVPFIDTAYRTDATPEQRTILGTSYGGFNSAFFGVTRSDIFNNIALQSPALARELIDVYRDYPFQFLNIFMSGGTLSDDYSSDAMAAVLTEHGYDFDYLKVNEGHSWGAWRGQLDEVLLATVGAPIPEPSCALLLGTALALWVIGRRRTER